MASNTPVKIIQPVPALMTGGGVQLGHVIELPGADPPTEAPRRGYIDRAAMPIF